MSAFPDRIIATYRLGVPESEAESRALAIATEQSVEMPLGAIHDAHVLSDIVARVVQVRAAGNAFQADIAISTETTGQEPGQLINMVFGNCSLMPEVELVRLAFPPGFAERFGGPRFGIPGLREATGVQGRPLTCTALKPQGSPLPHLVHLARTFALAGLDIVKDDHGLANQAFSPFAQRVPVVQRAVDEANRATGGRTLYAPTLSGAPAALAEQARIARDCGVRAALVSPMIVGLPVFAELARTIGIPLLAHPAFGGASRIAPELLFGRIFRLFGADATIFTNYAGRFRYPREVCLAIAHAAREPWDGLAATMPVPAGGMTLDRVAEMHADYGDDVMLLIGGNLLEAGERLLERSRAFARAVAG
jgi:ribulose-bisphosphate carboxylase large chain